MRAALWRVLAASVAASAAASVSGCAVESFDDLGPVRLHHQPVASGTVWAASDSSFNDTLRDPSIIEIGDRILTIGPDACAATCADCQFDRATLAFVLAGGDMTVTGTCGDGDRLVEIR